MKELRLTTVLNEPLLLTLVTYMRIFGTNQVKYCVPVKRLLTTKQGLNLLDAVHLQIDRRRCRIQKTLARLGGFSLSLDQNPTARVLVPGQPRHL